MTILSRLNDSSNVVTIGLNELRRLLTANSLSVICNILQITDRLFVADGSLSLLWTMASIFMRVSKRGQNSDTRIMFLY